MSEHSTGAVLSVTTGILMCTIGGVYEVMGFLADRPVYTHELSLFADKAKAALLAFEPGLPTDATSENWQEALSVAEGLVPRRRSGRSHGRGRYGARSHRADRHPAGGGDRAGASLRSSARPLADRCSASGARWCFRRSPPFTAVGSRSATRTRPCTQATSTASTAGNFSARAVAAARIAAPGGQGGR